jgi:RES domain-containing protein
MKIGALSGEPFYRMHTPRWAVMPTSGAGAAKHGGRFNRPGVPALYLADTTETAIAEYKQDLTLMPPGTLVQYELSLSATILVDEYEREGWDSIWEDWNCEWRKLALEGTEPPSWLMGDIAIESGANGILFPSTKQAGGRSLVVYTELLGPNDVLRAVDPRGDIADLFDILRS